MIEVLKQMVEALETYGDKHRKTYLLEGAWDDEITKGDAAIQAGKKAIAELESQEPFDDLATELFVVAQVSPADDGFSETIERIESWLREHFTHPPQRTWVGLTDEELAEFSDMKLGSYDLCLEVEAKLKEKNTN